MLQERFATLKMGGETAGEVNRRASRPRRTRASPTERCDWPEPIRERLEGMDTDFLKPTLALRNERTRYLILENKTELAELSLDKVKARRPGEEREVRFLELEVEARAGSDEDLQRIAGVLKRFLTLTPESLSKPRSRRSAARHNRHRMTLLPHPPRQSGQKRPETIPTTVSKAAHQRGEGAGAETCQAFQGSGS